MSSEDSRQSNLRHDEVRLGDLPAKAENDQMAAANSGSVSPSVQPLGDPRDDDVIRIEDLTPREHVKGGRRIVLGEIVTGAQDLE